jgi:acyl carrier protein
MHKSEFFRKLESILELEPGAIQPQTRLDGLEAWDSLSVITFIAMADRDYGVSVPPKSIVECQTAEDLADLVAANKAG